MPASLLREEEKQPSELAGAFEAGPDLAELSWFEEERSVVAACLPLRERVFRRNESVDRA
ncbi:MAG: hypothetical protein WBC63_06785 [Candidatus Bipolaricaulia bacterium]